MNAKDERLGNVECHDRRCPGRPCYHPLCMAQVGSRDYNQCLGWDGNEEPCPGKMPKKAFYCGECEHIKVRHIDGHPDDYYFACGKWGKKLRDEPGKIFKCYACLQDKRLKWFEICESEDARYSEDIA